MNVNKKQVTIKKLTQILALQLLIFDVARNFSSGINMQIKSDTSIFGYLYENLTYYLHYG